jgi:hypothetical protein
MLSLVKIYQESPETQRIGAFLNQLSAYCVSKHEINLRYTLHVYNFPQLHSIIQGYYNNIQHRFTRIMLYKEHKNDSARPNGSSHR